MEEELKDSLYNLFDHCDTALDRSSICFEEGGLLLALHTSHEMLLC